MNEIEFILFLPQILIDLLGISKQFYLGNPKPGGSKKIL